MLHQAQSADRMEVVLLAAFGRDSAIEIRAITYSLRSVRVRTFARRKISANLLPSLGQIREELHSSICLN